MAEPDDKQAVAASQDPESATNAPTEIVAEELADARLDERWRHFCLNAELYVAETTRTKPERAEQPA